MAKLQLALDDITSVDALELTRRIGPSLDIAEIGTPLIMEEGMAPVRAFRRAFPGLAILADTKIMDAGDYEARLAFEAGADYVTVLGVTDIATIKACLGVAATCGKAVVVDMICVPDLPTRIAELEAVGVTCLAVHTGVDQQALGRTPLDDLKTMKQHARASTIFVAGGITLATLPAYLEAGADVVIVGSGIRHASDPVATAAAFRTALDAHRSR